MTVNYDKYPKVKETLEVTGLSIEQLYQKFVIVNQLLEDK